MADVPPSRTAINKAGARIASGTGTDEDEALLRYHIEVCDEALTTLTQALRDLGFEPTSRLKNRETILDKVRRASSKITRIRDIAGCRIVVSGTRAEQDNVVAAIAGRLDQSRIIDRRVDPRFGYRAVHIEAVVDGRPVEIQVRTERQHQWAELFERLGDVVGREIRYGLPVHLSSATGDVGTRLQSLVEVVIESMSNQSESIDTDERMQLVLDEVRVDLELHEHQHGQSETRGLRHQISELDDGLAESLRLDAEWRQTMQSTLDDLEEILRPTLD